LLFALGTRIVVPVESPARSTRIMNLNYFIARFAYLFLAAAIVVVEGFIFNVGAA
jgi:hypothetical protein